MKAALEAFGRIDGLVNNAGYNSRGTVETVALENIERIIEVNLKAPIRLSKLVLPHLRASGGGAIVNVASLAGRVPLDHEATYSASKFGLRGFSFAMAEELAGSGITVSVVSPGPIETGFILNEIEDVPDMVFSQPMATADEVARAIVASLEDGKRERVMNFASGPARPRRVSRAVDPRGAQALARGEGAQGEGALPRGEAQVARGQPVTAPPAPSPVPRPASRPAPCGRT